ncbi:MobF family relaxase [Leifsonia sp. McL0607]|uniref:MobF family relaxase n=1 Tax=Leifsonia sp. McL0607 TaxID=3415672 RepID=UPI003CE7CA71
MMTPRILSAGAGYEYYLENVASDDQVREKGTQLADYYAREGNPPGVWMGGGIKNLGVSGVVTEAQMRALFGEGLHPDADAITERMVAAGASEKDIQKAVKLGRRYYKYDVKDTTLREAVDFQIDEFTRTMGRAPDRAEARKIRMREGAILFRETHGRDALDYEELSKYVNAAMKPGQHAVAGIDLTFAPPKSVSLAMMLGDDSTTEKINTAIERALEDTIEWLEREAVATRAGVNGVRQLGVDGGLNITRFRHYESRTGDPHVHDHVVVSNKSLSVDRKWRTLDSNLLLRMSVAASEYNTRRLFDHLDAAGIPSYARIVTEGKRTVREIVGVPAKLIDVFSSRGRGVRQATERLTNTYIREHGHAPDKAAQIAIDAQAWRDTRPQKAKPRTLRQVKTDVQRTASLHAPDDAAATVELTEQLGFRATQSIVAIDLVDATKSIMATVEQERSTWRYNHVVAELNRYLNHNRYATLTLDGTPVDTEAAYQFILRSALTDETIEVTPDPIHSTFQPLEQTVGELPHGTKATVYTSGRILDAEHRVLSAARTEHTQAAPVTEAQFAAALAKHPNKDVAQVALAHAFVTRRTQIVVGVGPAGAGKTRSMKLAAAAVQEAGGRLIGLTPSKQAAKVFAREVGVPAYTIDALLTAHREAAKAGTDVSARYAMKPGDVYVIDEGFMGATSLIDQATQLILGEGGFVRPLGDHAQNSAPGAGGIVRWIAKDVGAVELENIYRFTNHAERDASKILRESPAGVDPFAWYKDNGRIIAATKDRLVDVIFADYLADLDAGRESVMGAPTRTYVDELNARAQAHAIATGTVRGRHGVRLSDGHLAHVGDRVLTRRNDNTLKMNGDRDNVDNGDLYTVTQVHRNGTITVRHLHHGGTITLPASYVTAHTELGYAFTGHALEGDTFGGRNDDTGLWVDGAARGVVTARSTRSNAYVLGTRGTDLNVFYVEIEPGQHPDDVLAQVARNLDTNLSAHEMIDVEAARVHDLSHLIDQHADLAAQAHAHRFALLARTVLDSSAAAGLIGSDGWDAVAAGLARAEKHGMDPAVLLQTTYSERGFSDADDIGAVLSWRVEKAIVLAIDDGGLTPLPDLGSDTGLFEWAVDRAAQNDPQLPEEWRTQLAERAAYIDQRMTLRGAELVAERPDWSRALGPVPANPARQKRWMRLAAEIELFRTRYKVDPSTPEPVPAALREGELGRTLTARVTAMHKSSAISRARGNTRTLDADQHLQRIKKLSARIEKQRPIAAAEHAVNRLDPDRVARRTARREQTLRDQLLDTIAADAPTPSTAAVTPSPIVEPEAAPSPTIEAASDPVTLQPQKGGRGTEAAPTASTGERTAAVSAQSERSRRASNVTTPTPTINRKAPTVTNHDPNDPIAARLAQTQAQQRQTQARIQQQLREVHTEADIENRQATAARDAAARSRAVTEQAERSRNAAQTARQHDLGREL